MRGATSKGIYRTTVLLGLVLVGAAPPLRSAQEASENGTLISLGAVAGAPKSQVIVPLFLTPVPAETQVGSISATIDFENKGVTFLRAEKGFLLDGVNGSFQVEAQKDANDPKKSTLHLEVSTKGEPRKALRDGLLLSLVFRIEADASPSTIVTLDIQKVGAGNLDTPPKAILPVLGKKGTIEVLKPEAVPYVGCFFFTH